MGVPGEIGLETGSPSTSSTLIPITESECPCQAPSKVTILSLFVAALAKRIAAMTASVPLLVKVTRSNPVISQINSATSPTLSGLGPISTPSNTILWSSFSMNSG